MSKSIVTSSVVCLLLIGGWLTAQETARKVDKRPGLAVGKLAPDFELKDQAGKSQKLSELLKQGPVAVVFHRSADW